MAYDILRGRTKRDFARGEAPARGSWEYCGVADMWEANTRRDISGAPIMTTVEDASSKMNALLTDTENLNQDITQVWFPKVKNDATAQRFVTAWIRWRNETYRVYKDALRRKIIPDLAWQQWNRADAKMRELAQWKTKFQKLSRMDATAPTSEPDKPEDNAPPGWLKWIVIGLGVVAGGYAVGKVANVIPHKGP